MCSRNLYAPLFIAVVSILTAYFIFVPFIDPLNNFSENHELTYFDFQIATLGFCANFPLVNKLQSLNNETSNTPEEDYAKQSIYSLLYGIYRLVGQVESENGIPYEFTFNTWGIDGDYFPKDDPQRMGREAYRRLTHFPEVKAHLESLETPSILEVGCGTGAGANLTSHLWPNSHYIALDMQKQAIDTCNRLHAHEALDGVRGRLQCVRANGMNLPFPPNSFDVVIISETHIAEYGHLTKEDLIILDQIRYVLKPGGFFSWGNALVTKTWGLIENHMSEHQSWELLHINDVTQEAITAREEDFDRVEKYVEDIDEMLYFLRYFPTCKKVVNHLILDFYRHPNTRLFTNMVTKQDAYKQLSMQLKS